MVCPGKNNMFMHFPRGKPHIFSGKHGKIRRFLLTTSFLPIIQQLCARELKLLELQALALLLAPPETDRGFEEK